MKITQEKLRERRAELLTEEYQQPESWWYLSFAGDQFNGAVVIKAHGMTDAIMRTHMLNINPGGEVMAVEMPDEIVAQVPEESRNRLLTQEDVQAIWSDAKTLREHEEEEGEDG